MAGVKDAVLFGLVHDFFKVYLPKQRRCSPHTIRTYRISLEQLFDYVTGQKQVSLADITFEMLTKEVLSDFLDWLEITRGCSISTRNHRLACVRAFFHYAADMEPVAVSCLAQLEKVPKKNSTDSNVIEYMVQDAVFALLNQPDTATRQGLRDQCFMVLAYDSAARVQELIDLRLRDVHFGKTPTVTLTGKGNKVRSVPLTGTTVRHIQQYLRVFHPNVDFSSGQPLFYIFRNGTAHSMSDDNIRRFMKKYGQQAKMTCPSVPENIHPHLLRHSRAMHLYQQGMDLTLISQWLGHAHLKTTLVYAHADTEHKRKAIEKATSSHDLLKNISTVSHINLDDDDVVKRLYGLR